MRVLLQSHQCQWATNQTKELGWLSYLSNILSPTGQKVGGQNIFARSTHKIVPNFQNRGAAHENNVRIACSRSLGVVIHLNAV